MGNESGDDPDSPPTSSPMMSDVHDSSPRPFYHGGYWEFHMPVQGYSPYMNSLFAEKKLELTQVWCGCPVILNTLSIVFMKPLLQITFCRTYIFIIS